MKLERHKLHRLKSLKIEGKSSSQRNSDFVSIQTLYILIMSNWILTFSN